jgi:hypothetical protein
MNLDGQPNRRPHTSEHVDERISNEEIDTASEKVAEARLHHAQCLGGSLLLKTTRRNELLYLNHEVSPDQQMLGFLSTKSQITEDIPSGYCNLRFIQPIAFE